MSATMSTAYLGFEWQRGGVPLGLRQPLDAAIADDGLDGRVRRVPDELLDGRLPGRRLPHHRSRCASSGALERLPSAFTIASCWGTSLTER